METAVMKPSKVFYGVAGVIFVAGIISFVIVLLTGIFSSIDRLSNQVVVPGTEVIELKETGKYSIYFEYRSIIDGRAFETSNINGLTCTLKNTETGEYIKLNNPTVNSNYSVSGREGRSLFDFDINKTGKYEIKAWYESGEGEKAVLVIGQGFGMSLVRTVLISIGILFVAIGGSIAIFIYTLLNRKKAKDNFNTQAHC